jgi:hypothetical protein
MDYKPDVCKVLMLPGFVCHKGVFRIMPLTRMVSQRSLSYHAADTNVSSDGLERCAGPLTVC